MQDLGHAPRTAGARGPVGGSSLGRGGCGAASGPASRAEDVQAAPGEAGLLGRREVVLVVGVVRGLDVLLGGGVGADEDEVWRV